MSIAERLAELGLQLPDPPQPQGEYVPVVVHDGIAQVSGQVSRQGDTVIVGPVTADTPPGVVAHAGQACTLRALSALGSAIGGLDNMSRILFVRGFVHAQAGFQGHSSVLDEVSRLMVAIFGDCGRHARSAVGVAGLPGGGMLEIEVTAAVTVS
jgi:enamine deaminase RidA (YjgF/YER057c/UK114 family)